MRILLSGYNGVMGKEVSSFTNDIVAGYSNRMEDANYPVFTELESIDIPFDIILDFSHPSALKDLLNFAVSRKLPIIIASTGLSDSDHQLIDLASSHIPILQSGNFSLGLNLLLDITSQLTQVLKDFDVEVIEKHHNLKVDAPSGTALMLSDAVIEASDHIDRPVYGRHSNSEKRSANEVGVHSLRGGTIVGEHSVVFAGLDEVIEIKHTAYSKKIFVKGALDACEYLLEKEAGRYSMKDIISHD